ncbi:MAG: TonB-dependent receptor, partial [Myxococcota bacterium]
VAGRLQLLFTPNDKLRILFNLHAHSLQGTARLFRANIVQQGTEDFVDGFERDQISIDGQNSQFVQQLGFTTNLQYDFDLFTLTSITGYEGLQTLSRGDIDGGFGAGAGSGPGFIPFPSETADGIPELRQITQEVRLASNDWDKFNVQVGSYFFYEDLEIDSFSFNTLGGGGENGRAQQRQETRSFALFGSATYDVLDNLRIAGGLRYTDDQKNFVASRSQSPIGGAPIDRLSARPSDTFVSWDASISYQPLDEYNVYARVARSFRAPSIQGRVLFGNSLSVADSEKIISVEGGVKAELFDRRARINLAGFFYELSDQQLTAVGGNANFNTLLNADKSVGYGFEADAQFVPVAGLAISMGVSFNHTEIQDEDLAIAPCGAPCTVLDPEGPVPGSVLIDGNPLPHAPEWIFNSTLRYGMPVNAEGELFLFADLAYRSRISFFLYQSREFTDASLVELGLRVGYTRFDGSFEAALFSRNLNNNLSRTGGIDFNNLTGFVNEPRTFGAEMRFAF